MAKTLFIVNPNAGRTRKTWRDLRPRLADWVSDYSVVMTQYPEDVVDTLAQSVMTNTERIITVGGDGTNKVLVNALMHHRSTHPEHQLTLGTIPAGTGRDFARGTGIPLKTMEAAEYILTQAQPTAVDAGLVTYGNERHYFLNVANVGIAHDVVRRVENSKQRPWAFITSVIGALTRYQPEPVQIELDGEQWFEGNIYVVAVANGRYIGQGILIAPDADIRDGQFDVVLAEEMTTPQLIKAFPSLYTGKHITHPRVKVGRAQKVQISNPNQQPIALDMDGEPALGETSITYELLPSILQMLL